MTQAPEWFCPPGHPRETQLRRQWANLTRDRRRGGRALASWSDGLDRLAAEHEAHKRRLGEVGAMLDPDSHPRCHCREKWRGGEFDYSHKMRATLAALRRGIELGKSQ